MSDEVSTFIKVCATKGIDTPEAIVEEATKRISTIDNVLNEADKLRPEKSVMQSVIKTFGFELPKATRRQTFVLTDDITQENLDPNTRSLVIKICELLNRKDSSNREIMSHCNLPIDRDYEVYTTLKWMCRNGIAIRSGDAKNYSKGPQWDIRPV